MEDLNPNNNNKKVYEITQVDVVYQIPKIKYFTVIGLFKLFFALIGVSIAYLLYTSCMFNPNCNPIVTTFFGILGLSFFEAAGCPIEKLIPNMQLK